MTWKFPELEVDTGQFLAVLSDSCMEWIIQNISLGCYIPQIISKSVSFGSSRLSLWFPLVLLLLLFSFSSLFQ